MGKKEKLIKRLLSRPKDFTFGELTTLLGHFEYKISSSGKTSGSRTMFRDNDGNRIHVHKPHPGNILKTYQIDDIIENLKGRGLL